MLYQHLDAGYQERVVAKWKPILEAQGAAKITDPQVKIATAMVLENTQIEDAMANRKRGINESYSGTPSLDGTMGANTNVLAGGGALGTATDFGANDARMPTIVIPTARRIFPELLAHQVVGVQPMSGPVGFAFALRSLYGANGNGTVTENTEIGYNSIDSAFTGVSGNASSGSYWEAFAGTGSATGLGVNTYGETGQGETLANSEWWNIGEDMPMAKFRMEKGTVTARSRKLGAAYSLELAEDMMAMQGVDVDSTMVDVTSYEIQNEIDRQLLADMVKAAIASSRTSTWTPVSADGGNQLERISTLYTHMLVKANSIAITSRRGPASFAITSPDVCGIIERLQNFTLDTAPVQINTGLGVSKVGTLRNGAVTVFRDTFAMGNYILLGYKGPTSYDAGIIYCPYIPVQLNRAVAQENFSPRLGVRTRYGVLSNLFGAGNYYHMIKVDDLASTALQADGGRVFSF